MNKINFNKEKAMKLYKQGNTLKEISLMFGFTNTSCRLGNLIKKSGLSRNSLFTFGNNIRNTGRTRFKKGKEHINYGKHLSDDLKKKIGEGNKGKKQTKEAIEKIKIARAKQKNIPYGKNHHWWKGGITPYVQKLRKSAKIKKWREVVFVRDNYICQECGIRNYKGLGKTIYIEAHHIIPFSECIEIDYKEMIFNIDNGLTLCNDCHNKTKEGRPYES